MAELMQISKKKWFQLGGHLNPKCVRAPTGNPGKPKYRYFYSTETRETEDDNQPSKS